MQDKPSVPSVTGRIANQEPELQDFVQKHMTQGITNAIVEADYAEIENRMLIQDDYIPFPDMLPYENDVLESIIASGLGLTGLFMQEPMPFGSLPSPNMIHAMDNYERAYKHMPDMIVGDYAYDLKLSRYDSRDYRRASAPRVTERDKVLAKRAKDKANRKRARK